MKVKYSVYVVKADKIKKKKKKFFFFWSQEFTKKIVSIYFFIFVISNILFLGVASVATII